MHARRLRGRPFLLAEALIVLGLASLMLAIVPFRRVAQLLAWANRGSREPASANQARWIRRAINAWADRVPWRAVCFQRGIAAVIMLRLRGRAATLSYGAARDSNGALVAHVWVRSGSVDVIGCQDAADYGELAVFG